MGRETRTFRQTKGSNASANNARNFAKINKDTNWSKIISFFKKGGKV